MQICKVCKYLVVDETDPEVYFDEDNVSNYYYKYKEKIYPNLISKNSSILEKKILEIKQRTKKDQYDCLVGVSGGLDSSYMLHKIVVDYNLRPLVFHVDAGWNSEVAIHNINNLVDKLGLDLYTEVMNWEEMREFQLAFFKSGLPQLDVPQDMAFINILYKFAIKNNIKYIFNGGNIATEALHPPLKYYYWPSDTVLAKDVIKNFSKKQKLEKFPLKSIIYRKFYLHYLRNIQTIKPLNYIKYNKDEAEKELSSFYNWRGYGQKHFESNFTAFHESFWLPTRFNYDIRKNFLSSLILSNHITRKQALNELKKPPFDKNKISTQIQYIANKLEISTDELMHYHKMPLKFYYDYKNSSSLYSFGDRIIGRFQKTQRGGAF